MKMKLIISISICIFFIHFFLHLSTGFSTEFNELCCYIGKHDFQKHDCFINPTYLGQLLDQSGLHRTTHDLDICRSIGSVCCGKQRKKKQCLWGRETALTSGSCFALTQKNNGPHHQECCNCCLLGKIQREIDSRKCFTPLIVSDSTSCVESFIKCCSKDPSNVLDDISVALSSPAFSHLSTLSLPLPDSSDSKHQEGFHLPDHDVISKPTNQDTLFDLNSTHSYLDPASTLSHTTLSECLNGFAFNKITKKCEDIDECVVDLHQCSDQAHCYNTIGSHFCDEEEEEKEEEEEENKGGDKFGGGEEATKKKYVVESSGEGSGEVKDGGKDEGTKVEIQKEDDDNSKIIRVDMLNNTVDSATIRPRTRTRLSKRYQVKTNDPSRKTTISYVPVISKPETDSVCPEGYLFDHNRNACREIDECLYSPSVCNKNETCINTIGSYLCVAKKLVCNPGFHPDPYRTQCVDIDECRNSYENLCSYFSRQEGVNYRCQNLPGSYKCSETECFVGYSLQLHKDLQQNNTNEEERKKQKMSKPEKQEIERYKCYPVECGYGFYFEPKIYACTDINECEVWKDQVCARHQVCVNTQGSYACEFAVKCPQGFENDPYTGECQDIDECALRGSSSCDVSNSVCVNSPGSYHCRCNEGFQHDRTKRNTCVDINECSHQWTCQHQCHNSWGGYRCSCSSGFVLNPDNRTCSDIDECSSKEGLCHGYCSNTEGSYICYCPEGYVRSPDGYYCQDVDECEENSTICGSDVDSTCTNVIGGYKCTRTLCPTPFRRLSTGPNQRHVKCQRLQGHCRMSDVTCLKTPLSYSIHLIPLHFDLIKIPLNIFTMAAPKTLNYRLSFSLDITSSYQPLSGISNSIDERYFYLKQESHEGVIQLIRAIDEPTDIDMTLSMHLHDKHYRFKGTGEARILLFITRNPWEMAGPYRGTYHPSQLHPSRLLKNRKSHHRIHHKRNTLKIKRKHLENQNAFLIEIDKNDPRKVNVDTRMKNKLAYIERKKRREKHKLLQGKITSKKMDDKRKRKRKMKRKEILYRKFRNGSTKYNPVLKHKHYNYLNIKDNKINNINIKNKNNNDSKNKQ